MFFWPVIIFNKFFVPNYKKKSLIWRFAYYIGLFHGLAPPLAQIETTASKEESDPVFYRFSFIHN